MDWNMTLHVDIHFLHVDKHEWKDQTELINFGELCLGMAENAFCQ